MTQPAIHAQVFDTKEQAVKYALEKSKFNDFFLYLFFTQDSGKYVVDQDGTLYSNEILEGTFYQGERSL
jgi:hypothetical protein